MRRMRFEHKKLIINEYMIDGDIKSSYLTDKNLNILNDKNIKKIVYTSDNKSTHCDVIILDGEKEETIRFTPPFYKGEIVSFPLSYFDSIPYLNFDQVAEYQDILRKAYYADYYEELSEIPGWENRDKTCPDVSLYHLEIEDVYMMKMDAFMRVSEIDVDKSPFAVLLFNPKHVETNPYVWGFTFRLFKNPKVWNKIEKKDGK